MRIKNRVYDWDVGPTTDDIYDLKKYIRQSVKIKKAIDHNE